MAGMSAITADANVVIAYLESTHICHEQSVALLDSYDIIWVHPINMAEVLVGLPSARDRATTLADLLEAGYRFPDLRSAVELRNAVLALADLRASVKVKMPDACALATAIEKSTPLATYDVALRNAATKIGVTTEPNESQ